MLRDLVDRFAYRFELWSRETRGVKIGASKAPRQASQRRKSVSRLIGGMVQAMVAGLLFLGVLYAFAVQTFPTVRDIIRLIFLLLAACWCAVGLFMTGGEMLTYYSRRDDDDKRI